MASVRRKAPYRFECRINRAGITKSKTFATRADATAWGTRTERLILQRRYGMATEAESTTLAEAMTDYAEEVSSGKRNGYGERRMLERLCAEYPQLCAQPLSLVRLHDLRGWRRDMLRKMAPGTFNRYRSLLHHLFVVAASDWGFEDLANPVSKLRRAKEPPGRDRRVSDEEVEILVTTAARLHAAGKIEGDIDLPDIIRFALVSGMRTGEIACLTWRMIDFSHGVIRLRGGDTKTAKARLVPLFPEAESILRARRAAAAVLHGSVFNARANAISKAFIDIKRTADILDVRFHDLRHEFTSRKVEDGWGLLKVQQMTGHSTATMVKRYAHLDTTSLAAEIRQIPAGPLAASIRNST